MNISRLILCTALLPLGFSNAGEIASVPDVHRSVITAHCLQCHDSKTSDGGVDLEAISYQIDSAKTAETWQNVLNVLNSGEMPPEDETQLDDLSKQNLLRDLSDAMAVARRRLSDSGGQVMMRRLNRREYKKTMADLLGIQVDCEGLPRDQNTGGFDTNGSALFFSSDQFEQYLRIARVALDEALITGTKPPKVFSMTVQPEKSVNKTHKRVSKKIKADYDKAQGWRNSDGTKPPSEFGLIDEFDVRFRERLHRQQYATYRRYLDDPRSDDAVLLQELFNQTNTVKVTIPEQQPNGEYWLTVYAKTLEGAQRSDTYLEYGFPGARGGEIKRLGYARVPMMDGELQPVTMRVSITKTGPREIVIRHRQHNSRDAARSKFVTSQKATGFGPEPKLAIDRVELNGPHFESWPVPAVKHVLFNGDWRKQSDQDAYAREIIRRFATSAFRTRPPTPAYVDRLHALFRDEIESGKEFMAAIRDPLAIVLASPGFLYLSEPVQQTVASQKDPAASGNGDVGASDPLKQPGFNDPVPLSEIELAVRLSYLLWSAPPDDALMQVAKTNSLHREVVLRQHALRMLSDDRSKEFFAAFAHQWLKMERLDFFQFDSRLFPEFDDSVKESARAEVFETIRYIVSHGRPPQDLLDPGYLIVNDLLADYYDLPPVDGSHFRKVTVPNGSPRGGLLGMAAIHAMGSDGSHASLVERGAWVMRHLLNDPPPPAPPNVPQLSRVRGKLLSPREQMAAHMEQPQCASCHQQIDPIGYGLQNFDATGRWREDLVLIKRNGKKVVSKKTVAIDPTGALPSGQAFNDFHGLRAAVKTHKDAFAAGFVEALIAYALGRPYSFTDEVLRDRILDQSRQKDGSMREMILALIESDSFQSKN